MDGYRKLMVLAINKLLETKNISLIVPQNQEQREAESGRIVTELAGEPSVISWKNISGDELQISVQWKYNQIHQLGRKTPKITVGVSVLGWLERETAKHLQGSGKDSLIKKYTRRGEKQALEKLPVPTPLNYAAEGVFFP